VFDKTKGAVTVNKRAGFGTSMPDRFDYLQQKKKAMLPCPTKYFLDNDYDEMIMHRINM